MMFTLPTSLNIEGKDYEIKSDFRDILKILVMFEDEELAQWEKKDLMCKLLYLEKPPNVREALEKAAWFIDGGINRAASPSKGDRLYSFEQDKIYIFSGVDKTLGYSSRSSENLHWWVFLGAFTDMGEGIFSNITYMRQAHKENKLSATERKAWADNPDIYELKTNGYSKQDLLDLINE